MYRCAGPCGNVVPLTYLNDKKVKKPFTVVDHIYPAVDPAKGWQSYDDFISRLFCEADNLQLLCKTCHDQKTLNEKQVMKARRAKEKEINVS
mgnify:CR=1 FL=1